MQRQLPEALDEAGGGACAVDDLMPRPAANPRLRPGIRVLVADDHPLMREGIVSLIQSCGDMRVVAEAQNGREAVEACLSARPDVTLMDLSMPLLNGIDAIAEIRRVWREARIVVVTTYPGSARARRALEAGASGYLLKNVMRSDLLRTIRDVHAGNRVIPADIAQEIATHLGDGELSAREVDVLRGVADGNPNKRIGADLGVTEDAVKAHLRKIMQKLGARDRTHAVTLAYRNGIIDLGV